MVLLDHPVLGRARQADQLPASACLPDPLIQQVCALCRCVAQAGHGIALQHEFDFGAHGADLGNQGG